MSEGRCVLTRLGQTLVVTLEGAVDSGSLESASEVLSDEKTRLGADSVVFEVSACEVIDFEEFIRFRELVQTMDFLGLRSVVAGLRPGTVAYLASAGVSCAGLRTSLNLEHALSDLNLNAEPYESVEYEYDEPDDDAGPL
jgi:rsbT antagonist protein RsbS